MKARTLKSTTQGPGCDIALVRCFAQSHVYSHTSRVISGRALCCSPQRDQAVTIHPSHIQSCCHHCLNALSYTFVPKSTVTEAQHFKAQQHKHSSVTFQRQTQQSHSATTDTAMSLSKDKHSSVALHRQTQQSQQTACQRCVQGCLETLACCMTVRLMQVAPSFFDAPGAQDPKAQQHKSSNLTLQSRLARNHIVLHDNAIGAGCAIVL